MCCLSEAGVVTAWDIKSGVRRIGLQTNREGGSNDVLCLAYIHGSRLICLGGGIHGSVCVGGGIEKENSELAEGYVDFVVSETTNPMRIWIGDGVVCGVECGWYLGSAYMFIAQETGVLTVFKWDGKAGAYILQSKKELDSQVRLCGLGISAQGFMLVKLPNCEKFFARKIPSLNPSISVAKYSNSKNRFASTEIARKPNTEPASLNDRYGL